MIRTLSRVMKQDKERFKVPKSIQQAIPIQRIWSDGIFLAGGKYSMTFRFEDINYAISSKEDKTHQFLDYSEVLNSFEAGATYKITIYNRRLNPRDFQRSVLLPLKRDELDLFRTEYNNWLLDMAAGTNSIVQEKYITVSVHKRDIQDARNFFTRVNVDLVGQFGSLGSKCWPLDADERLRLLHDFYRAGEEQHFAFSQRDAKRKGHDCKDYICPDTLEFERDHFRMGDKYGRVLFMREYANFIKDHLISSLCELNQTMLLSIDIIPIPTDEAVREVENRVLGVETNITNWQRKQNQNNNYTAVIPFDLEQQRTESKDFLNDMVTRDQRMMFCCLTIVHTADTKEQLDMDTDTLRSTAQKQVCQLATLKLQQMDGLNTCLPIGVRKINALRTLTTESLAVLMPFRVQEVRDEGGIFYGKNAISQNMIFCNKAKLLNGSQFVLGVPGAGKSFLVKELIAFIALATDDDILICDVEREYTIADALGATRIRVAAGNGVYINAMDMVEGYSDKKNPIIEKSQFVLSLFAQMEEDGISARDKSIIDRCVDAVYAECKKNRIVPTLCELREKLLVQVEAESKDLALALELFTSGSLDCFAHPTNVKTDSRITVYDIYDLGEELKGLGITVISDAMLNRVTENWRKGIRTHLFLDEAHVMFDTPQGSKFFNSAFRRWRKRGAYPCAITQNVEYLLDSVTASTMLSNSEFIVMLNQSSQDRDDLAKLLQINSKEQLSYITNADAGCGLIRYGGALVPFINRFPENTKLYELMTTKPGETQIHD